MDSADDSDVYDILSAGVDRLTTELLPRLLHQGLADHAKRTWQLLQELCEAVRQDAASGNADPREFAKDTKSALDVLAWEAEEVLREVP